MAVAADRRVRAASLRLLVVTDRARTPGDPAAAAAAAVRGGADGVILRDRDLPPRQREALVRRTAAAVRAAGGRVLVHSDVALARRVAADGLHVAEGDGDLAGLRRRLPAAMLLGTSVHSPEAAARAAAAGADLLLFGNVWPTPTHPGRAGAGVRRWRAVAAAAAEAVGRAVPVLGVGGVTATRLRGAPRPLPGGVAAVAALLGAADPERAAGGLLAALAGERIAAEPRRRGDGSDERALVAAFLRGARRAGDLLALGPGDDAVVLREGSLAAAADLTIEGVHYLAAAAPAAVGWKAAARALSDLAAVGAEPLGVLVALALRRSTTRRRALALQSGVAAAARSVGARVLGGDTKETPGAESLCVTALGRVVGRPALPRGGARPGDLLFATGAFGGAGAGRHLRPRPRVAAGLALRRRGLASAAIDVSDGLAEDLRRLCAASGVGAVLDGSRVPVHGDARSRSDPLRAALGDGEDYELLFAVPPERAARVGRRVGGVAVREVGRCVHRAAGVLLLQGDGTLRRLTEEGWVHLRSPRP